jgi:hypothetical protein
MSPIVNSGLVMNGNFCAGRETRIQRNVFQIEKPMPVWKSKNNFLEN